MNDKQIVAYCKKLIKANLSQYADENPGVILGELYNLDNDKTGEQLLAHCEGIKELLEECIKILRKKHDKNK